MYQMLLSGAEKSSAMSALWEITDRCNLSCIHCYQGSRNNTGQADLSFKEACSVLEKLNGIGVGHLHFLGGEPLLYNSMPEIIRYARENYGMTSSVNTNGTKLTPALLQELSEAGVDNIVVSLDGASEESNDHIRGSGTFSLLKEKIKECSKHIEQSRLKVQLGIAVTLVNRNAQEIPDIFRFCIEHRLRLLRFVLPYEYGNYAENHTAMPRNDDVILSFLDQGLQQYQTQIKENGLVIISDLKLQPIEYFNRKYGEIMYPDWGGLMCGGGKNYCIIDTKGFLSPCVAARNIGPINTWQIDDHAASYDRIQQFKRERYSDITLFPCNECAYFSRFCEPCPGQISSHNGSCVIEQCNWARTKIEKRNRWLCSQRVKGFQAHWDIKHDQGKMIICGKNEEIIINKVIGIFVHELIESKNEIGQLLVSSGYTQFSPEDKAALLEAVDILAAKNVLKIVGDCYV